MTASLPDCGEWRPVQKMRPELSQSSCPPSVFLISFFYRSSKLETSQRCAEAVVSRSNRAACKLRSVIKCQPRHTPFSQRVPSELRDSISRGDCPLLWFHSISAGLTSAGSTIFFGKNGSVFFGTTRNSLSLVRVEAIPPLSRCQNCILFCY